MVHGDLKDTNVLVKRVEDFALVHVADWTSCTSLNEITNQIEFCNQLTFRYTPLWDYNKIYDYKSRKQWAKAFEIKKAVDVFAMGNILFIALRGIPPYPVDAQGHPLFGNPDNPKIPKGAAPAEIINLIQRMIAQDYLERPTAEIAFAVLDLFIFSHYPELHKKIQGRMETFAVTKPNIKLSAEEDEKKTVIPLLKRRRNAAKLKKNVTEAL